MLLLKQISSNRIDLNDKMFYKSLPLRNLRRRNMFVEIKKKNLVDVRVSKELNNFQKKTIPLMNSDTLNYHIGIRYRYS